MAGLDDVFKKLNRVIGQKVGAGERGIVRRFAHLLAEIRLLLSKAFEQYEVDGKLTWEEMAKYNRFNKFMKDINWLLKTHYSGIAKYVPEVLGDLYKEGFYLSAYGFEQEAKTKLAYATASMDQIEAALINPATKLTYKIWADVERAYLVHRIQQRITQGLVNGSTYATMAKDLKDDVGGGAYRSMRVVRTEGHRVSEQAKHDAAAHADKQGVRMLKTWNSLEDERVRRTPLANHAQLNNTTIPVKEMFENKGAVGPGPGMLVGENSAAQNINCRCFLTYTVDTVEKVQHEDISMGFDEWKQKRLIKR